MHLGDAACLLGVLAWRYDDHIRCGDGVQVLVLDVGVVGLRRGLDSGGIKGHVLAVGGDTGGEEGLAVDHLVLYAGRGGGVGDVPHLGIVGDAGDFVHARRIVQRAGVEVQRAVGDVEPALVADLDEAEAGQVDATLRMVGNVDGHILLGQRHHHGADGIVEEVLVAFLLNYGHPGLVGELLSVDAHRVAGDTRECQGSEANHQGGGVGGQAGEPEGEVLAGLLGEVLAKHPRTGVGGREDFLLVEQALGESAAALLYAEVRLPVEHCHVGHGVEGHVRHEVVAVCRIGVGERLVGSVATGIDLPHHGVDAVKDDAVGGADHRLHRQVIDVVPGVEELGDTAAAVAVDVHLCGVGEAHGLELRVSQQLHPGLGDLYLAPAPLGQARRGGIVVERDCLRGHYAHEQQRRCRQHAAPGRGSRVYTVLHTRSSVMNVRAGNAPKRPPVAKGNACARHCSLSVVMLTRCRAEYCVRTAGCGQVSRAVCRSLRCASR